SFKSHTHESPLAALSYVFFYTLPYPPSSPPFPYTTLFRSRPTGDHAHSTRKRSQQTAGDVRRSCQRRLSSAHPPRPGVRSKAVRSEEHTSELQSRGHLVCRLLLEKKKKKSAITSRLTSLQQ